MFVYHARLCIPYEPDRDLGLFHKKSDAKQACQDEEKDIHLAWDDSAEINSVSQFIHGDEFYVVSRRPIR